MLGTVAFGMEETGRLITAAAPIVASALGAMATSQLSVLKLLGAGLALAVLVDAFLIRGLLVPSAMRLLGRVNWWAPGPPRRLHARIGLKDGGSRDDTAPGGASEVDRRGSRAWERDR